MSSQDREVARWVLFKGGQLIVAGNRKQIRDLILELREQGNYTQPMVRVDMLDTTEIHDQIPGGQRVHNRTQRRDIGNRIHPRSATA